MKKEKNLKSINYHDNLLIEMIEKGINSNKISKELGIPYSTLHKRLTSLNYINKGYGIWERDNMQNRKRLSTSTKATHPQVHQLSQLSHLKEDISRGHAFIWKIRSPSISKVHWKSFLDSKQINYDEVGTYETPRILVNGNKVWLGKKHIIIFDKNSFFSKTALESKKLAIYSLLQEIKAIEQYLGIPPLSKVQFTSSREHYSLIKNILAEQCNKNGEKINVFNEKGHWLSIDDSFNLGELETLGSIANNPMETNMMLQKWWNSHKETKFEVTPKFTLDALNGLIINQEYHAENIKTHIKAIQDLGNGVNELVEQVKKLKNDPKNISRN